MLGVSQKRINADRSLILLEIYMRISYYFRKLIHHLNVIEYRGMNGRGTIHFFMVVQILGE